MTKWYYNVTTYPLLLVYFDIHTHSLLDTPVPLQLPFLHLPPSGLLAFVRGYMGT
jgi:hypothetical protein